MTYDWTIYFCLFLGIWSALVGGVFKAFSEFIMAGLARTEPSAGIEAMQQINRTVLRTEFVAALIAIAVISSLFGVYAMLAVSGAAKFVILLAALVYVPTVFLVTVAGNVPMNNRLDVLDKSTTASATYWAHYGKVWTRLNHVRTLGCIVTAGLYTVAAVTLITQGGV
ncbi:MAG: anthrone oxygenase family protein [Pseudomonadota bacterium]